MTAALDVLGDVVLSSPAGDTKVSGRGEEVRVELPSLGAARALLRTPFTGSRSARVGSLRRLGAGLDRSRVSIRFSIRGREVAEIGPAVRPGLLSPLLGLGPLRLRLRALAAALLAA